MAWVERYCRTDAGGAGDGTTEATSGATGAWTLAQAITGVAAGQRVNVRAGTYANTVTDRTFSVAGTTTAPIWWRGYTTAIGDLDTEPVTSRVPGTDTPLFTFTSGALSFSGAYQLFSHIAATVTSAGQRALLIAGAHVRLYRCRVDNQEAAAAAYAVRVLGNGVTLTKCQCKATTTATYTVIMEERAAFIGGAVRGGAIGLYADVASGSITLLNSVVDDPGANQGILVNLGAGNTCTIVGMSVYGAGSDGIRLQGTMPAMMLIGDCILDSNGGYGINNSTGTNTGNIHRYNNSFRNNTSGQENGFGDAPAFAGITESSIPFTDAAGHDFSLVAGALSVGAGLGLFEGETYTSALDVGAVQRAAGGGGGGPLVGGRLKR